MANTLKNIYSDLDLTFSRIPGKNDIALSYDEQSVIRSVRNLLLTNFYERPFQPNLGSNLDKLLFEPVNDLTASLLESDIKNTIKNYEPRVTLDYIAIRPNVDQNAYTVTIQFYVGNNTLPTAVNLLLQRSR
jgi:phage baseplate assembly protein W